MVDLGRIWQAASSGLSLHENLHREMPRVTSLCAHTILQKELLLVVPNLINDQRFRESPWAKSGIRFYAGTPLISPEGLHIGSLCVMDSIPREVPFGEEQQEQLMDLAGSVMDLMTEKRQSLTSNAPDYPGYTFSYDVQRAATFLRQQLAHLKDDRDFETVTNDAHRHALQSAFDSADFLYSALVSSRSQSQDRFPSEKEDKKGHEYNSVPPPTRREPPSVGLLKIGEHRPVDMGAFLNCLETAMEAFPRKVLLSFSVHPELPTELCFNDLKVFRSSIALLTSSCERTQEGFVSLKIFPRKEGGQARVVVFECEDTGMDVDLARFQNLFQSPSDGVDVGYEECIWINNSTGKLEHSPSREGKQNEPVSGGFAVHAVAEYVASMGGKYGFRPRFVQTEDDDTGTGSIFWFSIPLHESTTTPRPGTSVLDNAIDSASELSAPLPNASSYDIHRVDPTATRSWL